jgi:hypothetical protein
MANHRRSAMKTLRERVLARAKRDEHIDYITLDLIELLAGCAEALSGIMQLIDDADLVRNTCSDSDFQKFMDQGFKIMKPMKEAHSGLAKLEAHLGES